MEYLLSPTIFLEKSPEGVLIDVRTPSEFTLGHIPSAVNLPLFTDYERAEVGTLYVKAGKQEAIEKGLEIVGPKLASFVKNARELSAGKALFLYCWRGGMRSTSMAWLFRTAGFETYLLEGGYKAYRHALQHLLEANPWKFIVLGGPTGCGKTAILHHLQSIGQQVIDLEGLAHHKGSAFGSLGEREQPTTEQFGNELHNCMRKKNPTEPIWCEGESLNIGQVYIPNEFYSYMKSGLFIHFELEKKFRLKRILEDYGHFTSEALIACFQKIQKRLGGEATTQAIAHINKNELEEAIAIAIRYYDKGYKSSIFKQWTVTHSLIGTTNEPQINAHKLIEFYNKIIM
ncbi:MAG: tRNA 2-selenouridine(34) synthase MnmH [Porphyromonadaceae bacterium CG2_30_38_12]|nr:MAG: tRNA 2-selenouridine(34) synthase MnmH [Porphyromonadaceae bacterium CG2_30_38_12]